MRAVFVPVRMCAMRYTRVVHSLAEAWHCLGRKLDRSTNWGVLAIVRVACSHFARTLLLSTFIDWLYHTQLSLSCSWRLSSALAQSNSLSCWNQLTSPLVCMGSSTHGLCRAWACSDVTSPSCLLISLCLGCLLVRSVVVPSTLCALQRATGQFTTDLNSGDLLPA